MPSISGQSESTLDLDAAAVEPEQLTAAEQQANALAYTALPIKAYFVSDGELSTLPLRRPPKVTGQIRIVEIDGYDYSACGGTHVRTTAEIAPIKILRQERRRGQTRLTFVCGLRACQDYAERHRLLVAAANLFSNEVSAVPTLVQRVDRPEPRAPAPGGDADRAAGRVRDRGVVGCGAHCGRDPCRPAALR